MPETPRFQLRRAESPNPARQRSVLRERRFLLRLLGTAGAWFLMDVALYDNGVSSSLTLRAPRPGAPLLTTVATSGLIFLIAALPGYLVAAAAGKSGAFLGAFFFPLILTNLKLSGPMGILAVARSRGRA